MVTNEQTTIYREKVSRLLSALRNAIFVESGKVQYPTDASIAYLLELSPTALSSISRQCASMSGITLYKLLHELSIRCTKDSFLIHFEDFVC